MGRLLKQFSLLVLLIAAGAGAAASWLWLRSDEILRQEILKQFRQRLSGATVSIERARFDLLGRIHLYDVAVHLPGMSRPALMIPELVLSLDQQRFAEHQQIILQRIELRQPSLRIVRDEEGRTAWSDVRWQAGETNLPLPDIQISHGEVDCIAASSGEAAPVRLKVQGVQLQARPVSRARYALEVSAHTGVTGELLVRGQLPLEQAAWNLVVEARQFRLERETFVLGTAWMPSLATYLDAVDNWLNSSSGHTLMAAEQPTPRSRWDWGLSGIAHVQLHAAQASPDSPLDYRLAVQLHSGRIAHSALPFPLTEVSATLFADTERLIVRNLQASHGERRLTLQAQRERDGQMAIQVQAERVPIEPALVARLPEAAQRHIRSLALTGLVSGQAELAYDGQTWTVDAEATLSEGTVCHEKFPLLVRQISATASWHQQVLRLAGTGNVGGTPVRMTGRLHNPGPVGSADFDIQADDFVLNDEIVRACPLGLKRAIAALQLTGRGSARLLVRRPPGPQQKYHLRVWTKARKASLVYEGFRYPISELSGETVWEGDLVTFENLRGVHDGAVLTGRGFYELKEPNHLHLEVVAQEASFDHDLYTAVPTTLKEVWDAFAPQGRFNLHTVIDWTPGRDVEVAIPRLTIHRAQAQLRDFPYAWHDIRAEMQYTAGRLEIEEFSAHHDELHLQGKGVALCPVDRPWQVSFSHLQINDLSLTPALRRALPEALRNVVDTMNPQGRFAARGPVSFFGPTRTRPSVGATWDLNILLTGCQLQAGLLLQNVIGRVRLAGQFDGQNVRLQGLLDLDSLAVLENHQITDVRGPFRYEDLQLEVGSKARTLPPRNDDVPLVTQGTSVTGRAYDGEVTLDAYLDLRPEEPAYRVHLELTSASLERYAQRHLRGQGNVRGLMNGWMDLRGRGFDFDRVGGEGQLQISPAALYELPIFLQIFQLPQFQPIDRTAFNYANFLFTVVNQRFDFQAIDLVGNTLSLRGRGYVRFDGLVNLQFYTKPPRNQVTVPGVREVVGLVGMLGQGWIAVRVQGTVTTPVAEVVPLPVLDDALKQFLGAFERRPLSPPPPVWRGPPRASETTPPYRR